MNAGNKGESFGELQATNSALRLVVRRAYVEALREAEQCLDEIDRHISREAFRHGVVLRPKTRNAAPELPEAA